MFETILLLAIQEKDGSKDSVTGSPPAAHALHGLPFSACFVQCGCVIICVYCILIDQMRN